MFHPTLQVLGANITPELRCTEEEARLGNFNPGKHVIWITKITENRTRRTNGSMNVHKNAQD
jgi:hypothetical protein